MDPTPGDQRQSETSQHNGNGPVETDPIQKCTSNRTRVPPNLHFPMSYSLNASLSPTGRSGRCDLHVTHSFVPSSRPAVPPFAFFNRKQLIEEHRHNSHNHACKAQEQKLNVQASGEDSMTSTTGSSDSLDQGSKSDISPLQSIGDDDSSCSPSGLQTFQGNQAPGAVRHAPGQGACFVADFSSSCFCQLAQEQDAQMESNMTDSHFNLPHRHSVLDETLSCDESDFQFLGNGTAAAMGEGAEVQHMGWDARSMDSSSIHSMDDTSNGIEHLKSAQE